MMCRSSAHAGLKPKPVRRKPTDNFISAKKRSLNKVYKAQYNIELREFNKKKDLAYSIIYEACKKNATSRIARSRMLLSPDQPTSRIASSMTSNLALILWVTFLPKSPVTLRLCGCDLTVTVKR
jgi:hypothetical protein